MRRKSKFTKELLEPVVSRCTSYSQVLRTLGYAPSGGMHRLLQQHIKSLNIDVSHFTGRGWSRGKTTATSTSVRAVVAAQQYKDEDIFVRNSTYNSSRLRRRLLKLGWTEVCSCCGIEKWLEKPIRLHVDHINGDHSDHRLENLRFLCPNCHQQTPTWGNKTKR